MRQREIKTVTSLLLSLLLFLSLVAPAAGADKGHWAEEKLAAWVERGWLVGDGNGNLRPDDPVTRAEFATMVNRSFGLGRAPGAVSFTDLSESDWAYREIQTAVAQGYLKGNGDGTVRPHQPITREEAAVMIARLIGLKAGDANLAYKDRESIAAWSADAVASVSREGIFQGFPDGTFRPKAAITRAEAAVSLERALAASGLGTLYPKAGTYGPESGMETIEGNAAVTAAGVTLRNLHITGDLIIAAGVGEGDVYLTGVKVDGSLIVRGGGENSVHLADSVLVTVVVDKKTGTVRLVAEGTTVIREVEIRTPSIVHASGLSKDGGIAVINLSEQLPENSRVELRGSIDKVNVAAKLIHIAVPEGSIGSLQVDQTAQDVGIELAKEAAIVELVLSAVAKVFGEGEVGKAVVNSEGVSFDKAPKTIEIGENVPKDAEITIGGETKKADEVRTPAQPAPSSSSPSTGTPSNPSPSPGGSKPQDPSPGGDKPEDPSQGGDKSEDPSQGGDKPEDPSQGGDKPEDPSQGGDEPGDPSQGGDKPEDPSQGGDRPGLGQVKLFVSTGLEEGEDYAVALKRLFVSAYSNTGLIPVPAPQKINDQWYVEYGGVSYQIAVYSERDKAPIPIANVSKPDENNLMIELHYSFKGDLKFRVVFKPDASGMRPIEEQLHLPDRPVIVKMADNDSSPGLDGRDFSVTWVPSVRQDVKSTAVYIVPSDRSYVYNWETMKNWEPVGEFDFEAGVSPRSWTGDQNTRDSLGKPLNQYYDYFVVIAEFIDGQSWLNLDVEFFRPVIELNMDYGDKPNLGLPNPDDPKPSVTVSDQLPELQGERGKYAAVGDIICAKSNMNGYLYLLPVHYAFSQSLSYIETAIDAGEGLRVKAKADEWAELDTSWMKDGSYGLFAISEQNQIGDYEAIVLIGDASAPLKQRMMHENGFALTYRFNKEIFNNLESLDALRQALKIRDESTGELHDVKPENNLEIDGFDLKLTLPEWEKKGVFTLVVPPGTLKDKYGNVNDREVEAYRHYFRPNLTVQSDDFVSDYGYMGTVRKGGTLVLTPSKDIQTLYLIEDMVYDQDRYEQEVSAGKGKKLANLKGDVPVELSLEGLEAGTYRLLSVDKYQTTNFSGTYEYTHYTVTIE